jgi:hemolysin III
MALIRKRYSAREEAANSITHGLGLLLSVVALGFLQVYASTYGNALHLISVSIYGFSLIFLYTASTLYHSIQDPDIKAKLQMLDHMAIYLLIAGTYTPFTIVNLNGPWGWAIFGVIWCLALIGTVIQFKKSLRWRYLSMGLYLAMGWTILVAIKPLIASVATTGIILLLLGGLAYTFGILFYRLKSLKFNHAVWHIFVLAGSILHFFAVLFYVIPIQT